MAPLPIKFIRPAAVPGALIEHEVHAGEQVTGPPARWRQTAGDRIAGTGQWIGVREGRVKLIRR